MTEVITPRVSVVIPAYNAAPYLEQSLGSALNQTMPDLEVIVVDDASSDSTFEIATRQATLDSRVRVLRNELNRGPSVSRNRAFRAARGEWLALLDADDTWLPERLEQMLSVATRADVVSDDIYICRERFSLTRTARTPEQWSLLEREGLSVTRPRQLDLLEFTKRDIGLLKPIIRRSFLQRHGLEYNVHLRRATDYHLYFEILLLGAQWVQLPNAYYLYRAHASQISNNAQLVMNQVIKSAQLLITHPAIAGDRVLTKALKHRIGQARRISAYYRIREYVLKRYFTKLAHLLLKQPSCFPLAVGWAVKRLHMRVVRNSY